MTGRPRRDSPEAAARVRGGRRAAAPLVAIGLAALTIGVFAPVHGFEFVSYDDADFVTANRGIASGFTWESLRWVAANAYYATGGPVTWLSHLIDLELFGLEPRGHHVMNLALHVINVVILFGLLRALTGSTARSGVVAALFAVHPLHVETVAWISQRKDVMSTLFWWLTLWQYQRWVTTPSRARYALVLALFACGLMSKPIVIMLPVTLLLLDYWPLGRVSAGAPSWPQWRRLVLEKWPFAVLAVIAAWLTLQSQVDRGAVTEWSAPFAVRLYNATVSYAAYLGKAIWPVDLSPFYPYRNAIDAGTFAIAGLVLAVLTGVAVLARHRLPAITMGWGWYLATLVPVIGFVQVGAHAMADRLTYVPLVGIFVAVVWSVAAGAARLNVRPLLPLAAGVVVVIACGVVTRQQIWIWQNGEALWRHAVSVDPSNARALANLGATLAGKGKMAEALPYYREAVRMTPDEPKLLNNYGLALASAGDRVTAIAVLRRAIARDPTYAKAHLALADQLAAGGDVEAAFASYRDAIALDPGNGLAHMNQAVTFAEAGRFDEAAASAERALALDPDRVDWRFTMAMIREAQGRRDEAVRELEEVLRRDPRHARARSELARLRLSLS